MSNASSQACLNLTHTNKFTNLLIFSLSILFFMPEFEMLISISTSRAKCHSVISISSSYTVLNDFFSHVIIAAPEETVPLQPLSGPRLWLRLLFFPNGHQSKKKNTSSLLVEEASKLISSVATDPARTIPGSQSRQLRHRRPTGCDACPS